MFRTPYVLPEQYCRAIIKLSGKTATSTTAVSLRTTDQKRKHEEEIPNGSYLAKIMVFHIPVTWGSLNRTHNLANKAWFNLLRSMMSKPPCDLDLHTISQKTNRFLNIIPPYQINLFLNWSIRILILKGILKTENQ